MKKARTSRQKAYKIVLSRQPCQYERMWQMMILFCVSLIYDLFQYPLMISVIRLTDFECEEHLNVDNRTDYKRCNWHLL
jgi:hypothetical protein